MSDADGGASIDTTQAVLDGDPAIRTLADAVRAIAGPHFAEGFREALAIVTTAAKADPALSNEGRRISAGLAKIREDLDTLLRGVN
jgi:hypothetical protein